MLSIAEPIKLLMMVLALGLMKPPKPVRRAPPPKFDKMTNSIFMENAFDALEGERPGIKQEEVKKEDKVVKTEKQGGGDFDRSDMMTKLETAEASVGEGLSDNKTFGAATHKINSGADIFIMMGKTLFSNDPDYGQEDDYLKFAEEMTTAAKQLKVLTQKGDYEGASRAFSKVKKSCNSCHEKFRL